MGSITVGSLKLIDQEVFFYGRSLPSVIQERGWGWGCQFLVKECAQVLINRLED